MIPIFVVEFGCLEQGLQIQKQVCLPVRIVPFPLLLPLQSYYNTLERNIKEKQQGVREVSDFG
jgi:hypothetical protein